MSKYRIQIIRADQKPVDLIPGGHAERDLVKAIVDTVMEKGVGFWRTETHVKQAVEDAIQEVIRDLKADVKAV